MSKLMLFNSDGTLSLQPDTMQTNIVSGMGILTIHKYKAVHNKPNLISKQQLSGGGIPRKPIRFVI